MAAGTSDPDADALVEGTILEEQMQACNEIEGRIMRPDDRLDPTDEENVFTKIDFQYAHARDKTKDVLANRHESVGLNTHLKTLIKGFIEEREFLDRLSREGSDDDDLKTVVHWFKLYSTVVLDEYQEIPYEFALTEFKHYRDEVIEHPQGGIPAATERPEGSLLGFLTLSWNAMEEVLRMWEKVLSMDVSDINRREAALQAEDPKYGFVHNVRDRDAFVTSYTEGQGGKGTYFDVNSADYFPEEGDIVKLEDYDSGRRNLTARWVKRYDL